MRHVIEVPNNRYRFFVLWPLFILLVVLIGFELKTSTIPDEIILPAGLYLMVMAAWTGPLRWWQYPLTMLSIILALCALAITCEHFLGRETIGGGAIKLITVIGASVGLAIGFETLSLCLLTIAAILLLTKVTTLPSSPLAAVALYFSFGRRYGFNFLFAIKRAPVTEQEVPVVDVTPTIAADPPDNQLILQELRKTPTVARLGLGCIILFVLGVLLFTVLQGRTQPLTRYGFVTAAHALGFFAGLMALRVSPENMKVLQKNTRLIMIGNAVFAVFCGYRLVILVMSS